jgi:hypothetical protein
MNKKGECTRISNCTNSPTTIKIEKLTCWDPDSPGPHDSRLEVGLELVGVLFKGLALHQTEVTKEHASEDGVPDGLINSNLGSNRQRSGAWKLSIEETVKVVTGGSVAQEPKTSQSYGTHDIVRLVRVLHKFLCEDITGGETDQGCQGLGEERLRSQKLIVGSPESTHFELLNNSDKKPSEGRKECECFVLQTTNTSISVLKMYAR